MVSADQFSLKAFFFCTYAEGKEENPIEKPRLPANRGCRVVLTAPGQRRVVVIRVCCDSDLQGRGRKELTNT